MICSMCESEIKETARFCPKCGKAVNTETEFNEKRFRNSETQWYCLLLHGGNYQKNGPFSIMDLKFLLKNGKIDRNSNVWKEGYEEWVPIVQTELFEQLNLNHIAPPVKHDKVSNTWVWILAFAPLLSLVLYQIFGEYYVMSKIKDGSLLTDYSSVVSTLQSMNIVIALGLNIFLTWKDETLLKKLGHNTTQLGNFWLVPVYLFKRAKYLEQSSNYAIVWIVAFILLLI